MISLIAKDLKNNVKNIVFNTARNIEDDIGTKIFFFTHMRKGGI